MRVCVRVFVSGFVCPCVRVGKLTWLFYNYFLTINKTHNARRGF